MPDDFVTIAEAAAELGVSERALRRAVESNAARTVAERRQVTRQTRTGTRTAAAFPLSLLRELVRVAELPADSVSERETATLPEEKPGTPQSERNAAERGDNTGAYGGETLAEGRQNADNTGKERGQGDDPEKALLREIINDLRTALELEREAHKRAELLHLNSQGETQSLRERVAELERLNARLIEAKTVPASMEGSSAGDPYGNSQERPERPVEGAETGDSLPGRVFVPPGPSAGNFEEKREERPEDLRPQGPRPWWRRFFG